MPSIFETEDERLEKLRKKRFGELYGEVESYFEECEQHGLTKREGQKYMALDIFESLEKEEHLVVEAGVGIGKSFAYLVPLLYYFKIAKKSFIISTSTIALQEQLEKDIKKLSRQLNIPIDIVVAKGMSNFICLNRLENYNKENKITINLVNNEQDRRYYTDIKDKVWQQINVEKCNYDKCNNCSKCQFYNIRDKMKTIKGAIICNHDLLIEDLSRPYGYKPLLKDVKVVVCDEAHNLENKIRAAKTGEINFKKLKEVLNNAIKSLLHKKNHEFEMKEVFNYIEQLEKHINNSVEKQIEQLKDKSIDLEDCNGLTMCFDNCVLDLSRKIYEYIKDINVSLQLLSRNKNDELLQEEVQEQESKFNELTYGNDSNNLFWIERRKNKNFIKYAPKNISLISYKLLFAQGLTNKAFSLSRKTFILTSATLSTKDNDFSYFLDNIGTNHYSEASKVMGVNDELFVADSYESPYNYKDNTLLYCCGDIASPKNKEKYLNDIVKKIKELILITKGKALVLFTSKSDMKYVYEKIGKKIDNINIYIQNDGSSQNVVKEKFKNDTNSVLFSTGIFWEGIDIQGESLSNLIIARLPFPIVDPVLEYKRDLYGNQGFDKVYMPEMLIKLKQGVGRLIRSENDKGIVTILDSRLDSNNKYKSAVLETLPIKNFVTDIEEVRQFVKSKNI